jgi:hypothetical protein
VHLNCGFCRSLEMASTHWSLPTSWPRRRGAACAAVVRFSGERRRHRSRRHSRATGRRAEGGRAMARIATPMPRTAGSWMTARRRLTRDRRPRDELGHLV